MTLTPRETLVALTEAQPTANILHALATMDERWTTTGLKQHESLARFVMVSTITARHEISGRVNDLYLDEVDGFDGSELEAIVLALAESN